jgi:hypothetical protein
MIILFLSAQQFNSFGDQKVQKHDHHLQEKGLK